MGIPAVPTTLVGVTGCVLYRKKGHTAEQSWNENDRSSALVESTHKPLRAPAPRSTPLFSQVHSQRSLVFPHPGRSPTEKHGMRARSLVRGLMLKNRRGKNTLERRTSCHVFPGEINLCLELLCSAFLPGKTEMPSPTAFPLQVDKHSPAVLRNSI